MPTITRPVNAFEMPSASTAGSSASTNQSETKRGRDAAHGEQPDREAERAVTACVGSSSAGSALAVGCAGTTRARRRRRRAGRSRRRPRSRPGDGSRGRRRGPRAPSSAITKTREQQQRRRVVRQPRPEAHHAVAGGARPRRRSRARARAARSRSSEPRIEVWATTISPAESANRTMKSSGRLPSVDWSDAGDGRAEARADRLRGDRDQPREPAERHARDDEDRDRRRAGVVENACDDAQRRATPRERTARRSLAGPDKSHPLVHRLERRRRRRPRLLGPDARASACSSGSSARSSS